MFHCPLIVVEFHVPKKMSVCGGNWTKEAHWSVATKLTLPGVMDAPEETDNKAVALTIGKPGLLICTEHPTIPAQPVIGVTINCKGRLLAVVVGGAVVGATVVGTTVAVVGETTPH